MYIQVSKRRTTEIKYKYYCQRRRSYNHIHNPLQCEHWTYPPNNRSINRL